MLFLEAADDVLVRRFESVRRAHPLQGGGRLVDGIAAERELLADLRGEADLVVDTTGCPCTSCAGRSRSAFSGEDAAGALRATVLSFGFKYGLPRGRRPRRRRAVPAQPALDPGAAPAHRPGPGRPRLRAVAGGRRPSSSTSTPSCSTWSAPATSGEGKRYLTLASAAPAASTASVAMAEELAERLAGDGVQTTVVHRDLGRE